MAKTLPNSITIPTDSDTFDYTQQMERLALSIGAIPAVANDSAANQLVAALKRESNYPNENFAHLIYIKNTDELKLHDGTRLHSLSKGGI